MIEFTISYFSHSTHNKFFNIQSLPILWAPSPLVSFLNVTTDEVLYFAFKMLTIPLGKGRGGDVK